MNRNNKTFYLYFVIIMGLLMFTVWVGTIRIQDSGYTRGEFVDHLKNDQVAIVKVCPNKNTDAGALEITLKSGTERRLNVTNVSEAEDLARSYGLDPVVESVPEESWFSRKGEKSSVYRKHRGGKDISHQLYCKGSD